MPRLSDHPRPENRLALCDPARGDVTICSDQASQTFVFVGYDPATLRVRWVQRAPGSFTDPRGHRDYRGRDGLWRAFLDRDHRALLDRFQTDTLVDIVDETHASASTSAYAQAS
jgi:hypothetical protein